MLEQMTSELIEIWISRWSRKSIRAPFHKELSSEQGNCNVTDYVNTDFYVSPSARKDELQRARSKLDGFIPVPIYILTFMSSLLSMKFTGIQQVAALTSHRILFGKDSETCDLEEWLFW